MLKLVIDVVAVIIAVLVIKEENDVGVRTAQKIAVLVLEVVGKIDVFALPVLLVGVFDGIG